MVSKETFGEHVSSAYQHLYDFVRLRNHPLTQLLLDPAIPPKERGWQMHRLLLDVIDELDPGPSAPPYSKEWRRHRLMVLRYVEAMDPQAVADQLAISRRQYYREHAAALAAIADLLWERCAKCADEAADEAHTDAMQRELARISQYDTFAHLPAVIEGVVLVLHKVLVQNRIAVEMALPEELSAVSVAHSLLRQVLVGALGYLADHTADATVHITANTYSESVHVRLVLAKQGSLTLPEAEAHAAYLREILQVVNADVTLLYGENGLPCGFELRLPAQYEHTVSVVDDNEDTLTLFRRYLAPNRYRVITTSDARAAIELAREVQPDAIILDLMMPEQDGWDVLQHLTNQSETAHIPIMICSVLKQQDLALSLGAAAYLPKPFTEQTLLETLRALHNTPLPNEVRGEQ